MRIFICVLLFFMGAPAARALTLSVQLPPVDNEYISSPQHPFSDFFLVAEFKSETEVLLPLGLSSYMSNHSFEYRLNIRKEPDVYSKEIRATKHAKYVAIAPYIRLDDKLWRYLDCNKYYRGAPSHGLISAKTKHIKVLKPGRIIKKSFCSGIVLVPPLR